MKKDMKQPYPVVGAVQPYPHGREGFQRFLESGFGNFVILMMRCEEDLDIVRECVKRGIYFQLLIPSAKTKSGIDLHRRVQNIGSRFYLGTWHDAHEYGGICYWPRSYFNYLTDELKPGESREKYSPLVSHYKTVVGAMNVKQAYEKFLGVLKKEEKRMRRRLGSDTPIITIESSLFQRYLYEAGFNRGAIEMFVGDPMLMYSALRGSSKAYDEPWDAYVAKTYSGFSGSMQAKRFALGYYLAYLLGARAIYDNGTAFKTQGRDYRNMMTNKTRTGPDGKEVLVESSNDDLYLRPEFALQREGLKKFAKFARKNPHPTPEPLVRVAVVQGHYDGYAGMWDRRVWGQHHSEEWRHGDAERGWDFFQNFFQKTDSFDRHLDNEANFTGNPPMGQIDIVPSNASAAKLKKYKCLLFLGWNTMTADLYERLKDFVVAGGRLIMSTAHLSTHLRRNAPFMMFNKGDVRDLFGVKLHGAAKKVTDGVFFTKDPAARGYTLPVFYDEYACNDPFCVTGEIPLARMALAGAEPLAFATDAMHLIKEYPVLTENRLGKGSAFLITPWCYPGHPSMDIFMRVIIQAIINGEQGPVRFAGSDQIRWAAYKNPAGFEKRHTIYLLNTDFDVPSSGILMARGEKQTITIPPCEIQIVQL